MNFGEMLERLKKGDVVIARRRGWNGKNMAIAFMPAKEVAPGDITPRTRALLALCEGGDDDSAALDVDGYLAMYTARGTWQPGWLASQNDMLADDWEISADAGKWTS